MSIDRINNKAIHEGTDYTMHSLHAVDSVLTTEIKHPNGITGLTIDENGYMLTPNRPAFQARYEGGPAYSPNELRVLDWTALDLDTTNSFDTASGRYTCPAKGVYILTATCLRASGSNTVFRGKVYRNGSQFGGEYRLTEVYSGFNDTASRLWIVQADVGDYLEFKIYADSAGSLYNSNGYNYFIGYYIG